MNISMVELKGRYESRCNQIDHAILQVLAATHYMLGLIVQVFDDETASYLGAAHTIICPSSTNALHSETVCEAVLIA